MFADRRKFKRIGNEIVQNLIKGGMVRQRQDGPAGKSVSMVIFFCRAASSNCRADSGQLPPG